MGKDLNQYVSVYKEQLSVGDIKEAYTGLVKYVTRLGSVLSRNLSKDYTFGGLFQGYMDYTYFYYTNDFLKKKKLKMSLVLNHSTMQFEIWLLGQTLPVQKKYWEYFKNTKWNKHRSTMPKYSILEAVIIETPNFNDLATLSELIESSLVKVSKNIMLDITASKLD